MRSLKIALPLIAAVLAAGAAQADPVKIRLSYVVAPSDWAPLLPEKPDLLKHNGKSYQLEKWCAWAALRPSSERWRQQVRDRQPLLFVRSKHRDPGTPA